MTRETVQTIMIQKVPMTVPLTQAVQNLKRKQLLNHLAIQGMTTTMLKATRMTRVPNLSNRVNLTSRHLKIPIRQAVREMGVTATVMYSYDLTQKTQETSWESFFDK